MTTEALQTTEAQQTDAQRERATFSVDSAEVYFPQQVQMSDSAEAAFGGELTIKDGASA